MDAWIKTRAIAQLRTTEYTVYRGIHHIRAATTQSYPKVYHAWKAKNKKKNAPFDENARAPTIVMEEAASRSGRHRNNNNAAAAARKPIIAAGQQHRFFRIPFVRPETGGGGAVVPAGGGGGGDAGPARPHTDPAHQNERGWWYAHFDGEWIGRQMELHEGRPLTYIGLIDFFCL
jgi:myosin-6